MGNREEKELYEWHLKHLKEIERMRRRQIRTCRRLLEDLMMPVRMYARRANIESAEFQVKNTEAPEFQVIVHRPLPAGEGKEQKRRKRGTATQH